MRTCDSFNPVAQALRPEGFISKAQPYQSKETLTPEGVRYNQVQLPPLLPYPERALHFGHRAEPRIFTLPQGQNIIQLSRSQTQQKAALFYEPSEAGRQRVRSIR